MEEPTMSVSFVRLIFEHGFDERTAFEAEQRGLLTGVWVELSDGSRHEVSFFDSVRLEQELAELTRQGRPFFHEPGLIVLAAVTLENMELAARTLAHERGFARRSFPHVPEPVST